MKTTIELAKNSKLLLNSRAPEERKQLLEMQLSNLKLDGVKVQDVLKKPFQILLEIRTNPKWRRTWDSNPRYAFTYTPFPRERHRPLSQFSVNSAQKNITLIITFASSYYIPFFFHGKSLKAILNTRSA